MSGIYLKHYIKYLKLMLYQIDIEKRCYMERSELLKHLDALEKLNEESIVNFREII